MSACCSVGSGLQAAQPAVQVTLAVLPPSEIDFRLSLFADDAAILMRNRPKRST